jgi:hypothetical protein
VAAAFAAECDQSRVRFVDGAGDALDRLHGHGYDLGWSRTVHRRHSGGNSTVSVSPTGSA